MASSSTPPNLPCGDLLGNRDSYNKICVPFYNASMKGDWEAARVILEEHKDIDLLGYAITENYDTALHIAASAKSSRLMEKFVKNLVDKMTEKQLELQNKDYKTALCLAARNINVAMAMVEKNRALLEIPAIQGSMPLYFAALSGQREVVNFFYDNSNKMTGNFWIDENRTRVFEKCVELDLFDVALKIVTDRPELAVIGRVLGFLAQKTDAFGLIEPSFFRKTIHKISCMKVGPAEKPSDALQLLRVIWTNIMMLREAEIDEIIGNIKVDRGYEMRSMHLLFVAAEKGNTEFVVELIRQYPDLLWKRNEDNQTIFHVAVKYRHEDIYNLLHEIGSMKDMIISTVDTNKDNMLHLAAMLPDNNKRDDKSGVGLQMQQMQREVLWFKEVEDMVPPSYRKMKNDCGQEPHEIFQKEHRVLLSENEKWMKDTANQCLVVAALVASIGFAATFAVPGGYDQNNGIPIFLHKRSFIVFAISDAISLAFSSMSILIFLSIFISRYAENDFLESLPRKLMKGLAALFFSITAMLVGFGVSFFTFYQDKLIWVPIIISMLISLPIILYARLQYYLLMDVYQSTYGSRNLFKPKKPMLYYLNPRL